MRTNLKCSGEDIEYLRHCWRRGAGPLSPGKRRRAALMIGREPTNFECLALIEPGEIPRPRYVAD
jgi:hypothetical protein